MTDPETPRTKPVITLTEGDHRGRYSLRHEDGRESELTFVCRGDRRLLDHTFTPRDLRHEGAAMALLTHAVEDLRTRGLKVVPVCPYVELQFLRHPEWADVLA